MTQVTRKFWPHDLVAGESINVRPGDEEVGDLLASIPVRGLLQALIGRTREDGTVEIIDGNRRLKALKQLFDEGRYQEQVEVHLRDGESDADAFEISLTANILRRQLHPVAEFEAFVALIEKGQDKQQVADHFGIPLRAVEQRLALGRLHEDVRLAWIEGRINGEAARAFTLASSADQATYLSTARWAQDLRPDVIRRAFTKETVAASSGLARFVSAEAYQRAGGAFVPDLFAEEPDFADGQLLNALANQKLAAQAETLRAAEGWGEVLFGEAATDKYRWHRIAKPALADDAKPARAIEIETRLLALAEHRDKLDEALLETEDEQREEEIEHDRDVLMEEEYRLEEELEQLTESQAWMTLPDERRAKAVAVLDVDRDGKLTIARGYMKNHKPAPKPTALAAPAPKVSAAGEEAHEPAQLSAALLDGLALTATRAAAHVVAAEPRLALAIFVASFATLGSPVRFRSEGRSEGPGLPWSGRDYRSETTFVDVLKSTMMLSIDELQLHTAKCVAHMLDFTSKAITSNSMDALKPQAAQAVRAALPFVDHRAALVQAFDPAEYFSAAPKQEAIAAIGECGDEPAKYAKLKKADLGAAATRLATARGWLPPRLRGDVFEAVLPAEPADQSPDDAAGTNDKPAEPETPASAADAALQIWLGEERTRLVAMKAPGLRELLKTRGVAIPFGSTKMQLIELALQHGDPDSSIEEAA
jgi:ParB family chromosome partitioning protein